ncbi:MAG: hypothetical protein A3J14_01965 [Candidatus Levybacteria bacterium RIFCSPLOWO2_02_FULL_37_18]|nr:MAG: hypothetical protein A3J14_01965 [Candidatus Levybacteria bacterium RIFCSPLOWO2_02_FULL_37_18]
MIKVLKSNYIYLILSFIVVVGFFLRSSGIFSNSFAFTYDVGRDLLAVRDLVVNHKISLIGATTGKEGIFYGPVWYWILAFPFIISSGNPQMIALFMAFCGILVVPIGYFLGEKIHGKFLGLTLAAFFSFSPVMIGVSSQIWNPNLIPLFVIILLSLLIQESLRSKKTFFVIGLLLGVILELEIVFGILLIVATGIYVLCTGNLKQKILQFFIFLAGIILVLFPKIIFDIRHNFLMTRSFFSLFNGPFSEKLGLSFLSNFPQRLQVLFNLFSDSLTNSNKYLAFYLLALCFVILIYFRKKLSGTQKKELQIIFITLLTFLIGLSFFSHDIWSHYIIGLPVYFILTITVTVDIMSKNFKQKKAAILLVVVILTINFNPVLFLRGIRSPLWEGNSAVYRNQLAVIDYVYNDTDGEKFSYVAYTPPIHDYTWQYLFLWYGQKKYHYVPSKVTEKLFYLILEPDYERPSRLKDWLEIRKNDGKIIKEQVVKGGIVVQTRIH